MLALGGRHCPEGLCGASCRLPLDSAFVEFANAETGPGIPAEVQQRMFEPFCSTKESGEDTGIGLAIVHGIGHGYGGHLVIRNEPGKGTTIRVLLS
jgi:signal transduction histidine kinase